MVQPETFPVCRGCGLIAPTAHSACDHCGTATGEHAVQVSFRSDGYLSVAVQMEFQCRACGHFAPANFLDLDGSLSCAHCGIEQAFAPRRFRDVLLAAHDVGDLAGPHKEGHPANRSALIGKENPHGAIGRTESVHATSLRRSDEIDLKVRLKLTRGRRLCHSCQMPVELYPDGQGQVTTVCSYCQARVEYALPAGGRELYGPLLGVIADEHRSDWQRSETVSADPGAPVAIQCPSCHAPLKVSASTSFARCQYCSTESVIPARAWARATGEDATPQIWFALFHGPSQARKRLAMEAAMEETFLRRARAARSGASPHHPPLGAPPPSPQTRFPWRAILLATILLGTLVMAAYMVISEHQGSLAGSSRAEKPAKRQSAKSREAKPRTPPPRSAFQALEYCSCLTEIDGKPGLESVTLANRIEHDEAGGLRLEIYMDVEKHQPRYLALGPKTAPPAHPDSSAIGIGVACDKHVVALISGHYATGWSAKSGKRLWSKKIAGSYRHPNPPPPKPGTFSTWCEQMRPSQGKATLSIGGGKKLQVRIADGQLTIR
ncbi:MAG: hypothetical protein JRI23_12210 [Deltaproteobacteria bacterium]|jgi:hypothetical protein|nr:hypothetical protein [Deltaproteobacteria bacterium]MBW2532475.1 hypothetical protein [Deltaproteobacteria bacterium]